MSGKLKACPFCGCDAGTLLHKQDDYKEVYCTNYKCFMADIYATAEQWNNRATSQEEAEMWEALEHARYYNVDRDDEWQDKTEAILAKYPKGVTT